MIDIKDLRDNPKPYKDSARLRGAKVDIDKLLELDSHRSQLIPQVDQLRASLNRGDKPSPEQLEQLKQTKSQLEKLESELRHLSDQFETLLQSIPNLVSKDTPVGKDNSENVVLRQEGNIPVFDFQPK